MGLKTSSLNHFATYEYNSSDFDACSNFLERYLSSTITVGLPISCSTVQYMISEVQYGGRITDDLDRELFNTYVAKWFNDDVFKPTFAFNNYAADFNYKIPEGLEIQAYRDYIDTLPMVDSPLISTTRFLKDSRSKPTVITSTRSRWWTRR